MEVKVEAHMEDMIILDQDKINRIVKQVQSNNEDSRRAEFKKRQDIYEDGGKEFLIEELSREFGQDSLKEMRLAPINLLKKIVNKRSSLYKRSPQRSAVTELSTDQDLIDYYTKELQYNEKMDKWNRYFTLHSNAVSYSRPYKGKIKLDIIPPYLYSVVPNEMDRTEADVYIFSRFLETGSIDLRQDLVSATGYSGYSRDRDSVGRDLVDTQSSDDEIERNFIFWTDLQHFTTDGKGNLILMEGQTMEDEFINPIGVMPVVNLSKDRNAEYWATQFRDTVDLSMAIMKGWSDLLTIAKHQGFSVLTVMSEEEPQQLTLGINKAVYLKLREGGPTPSINYVSSGSPLGEYKEMLMELLGLTLTTANLNPKEIGGTNSARNYSSGFQALIENSDILEARKIDMNPMRRADEKTWNVIAKWHNYLLETNQLVDEARAYGKFSKDFAVNIDYAEVKPLESEQERISVIKELRAQGLMTKTDAMKKLYPDMSDEQIEQKLAKIDEELANLDRMATQAMESLNGQNQS